MKTNRFIVTIVATAAVLVGTLTAAIKPAHADLTGPKPPKRVLVEAPAAVTTITGEDAK